MDNVKHFLKVKNKNKRLLKFSTLFHNCSQNQNLVMTRSLFLKSSLFVHKTLIQTFLNYPASEKRKAGLSNWFTLSVCLSAPVHKRQVMIEEHLNFNLMLYFEHESENKPEATSPPFAEARTEFKRFNSRTSN